jgi:hypothetical protein
MQVSEPPNKEDREQRLHVGGEKLPPPGQYKARFYDNGDVELMGPNAKGELHDIASK